MRHGHARIKMPFAIKTGGLRTSGSADTSRSRGANRLEAEKPSRLGSRSGARVRYNTVKASSLPSKASQSAEKGYAG